MNATPRAAVFAAAVLLAGSAGAAPFTGMVDFGDSLTDAGNVFSLTSSLGAPLPAPPGYSGGRFTNGPVWVQTLAPMLGLPAVTASRLGGNDYAYGGVTSGDGTTNLFFPNVGTQIAAWTAANTPTTTQLFTLLGGANDLFAALDGTATPAEQTAAATTAANNIVAGAQALYADGARNILVANLPNLGATPKYRTTARAGQAAALTATFDTTLAAGLSAVRTTSPGLNLYTLDLATLFAQATLLPASYGLTNVTDRAYTGDDAFAGNGTAVANPGSYLFWDSVHPTETGHTLIARAAFAAVPEPTGVAVVLLLAPLVRRRRAVR